MSYTGMNACGVGRSGLSEMTGETSYEEARTVEWMNVHKADNGSSGSTDDVALTEEEVAEIVEAIKAFVNTENWEATQQIMEAQQEVLFRPETELVFEQYIKQAKASGEQHVVELLEMHLAVLRARWMVLRRRSSV